MPLYAYKCPRCEAQCSELRAVKDRADGPLCYRCGQWKMDPIITPVAGIVRNPAVPKEPK